MAKGFQYPFRYDNGAPAEAKDETLVASSLFVLLSQDRGERPYDPANGTNLVDYTFENASDLVLASARNELRVALLTQEPRASLISVDAFYQNIQGVGLSLVTEFVWQYGGRRFRQTFSTPAGQG